MGGGQRVVRLLGGDRPNRHEEDGGLQLHWAHGLHSAGCSCRYPLSVLGTVMQMVSHGLISGLLFLLVGLVYSKTGTRDLTILRGLLNPERGLPIVGTLMILGVMASGGIPGMVGFISEFVVFRGSIVVFPVQTLLSLIGTALTAVYFLLLVNRVFFGRLAICPPTDAVTLDISLPPVTWAERWPPIVLAVVIVVLGIQPHWLSRWSEAASLAWRSPIATVAQVEPVRPVSTLVSAPSL
jgi:NAD(P)H-quinone oxidoreductase subunit 4